MSSFSNPPTCPSSSWSPSHPIPMSENNLIWAAVITTLQTHNKILLYPVPVKVTQPTQLHPLSPNTSDTMAEYILHDGINDDDQEDEELRYAATGASHLSSFMLAASDDLEIPLINVCTTQSTKRRQRLLLSGHTISPSAKIFTRGLSRPKCWLNLLLLVCFVGTLANQPTEQRPPFAWRLGE